MGCEALQHGAERVVAVENNARTAAICRENLELVASADTQCAQVSVIRKDLLSWLKSGRPADEPAFSMVYFDPPYAAGIYNKTLELLHRCGWVQSEGLVICEHASKLRLEAPAPWIEKDGGVTETAAADPQAPRALPWRYWFQAATNSPRSVTGIKPKTIPQSRVRSWRRAEWKD